MVKLIDDTEIILYSAPQNNSNFVVPTGPQTSSEPPPPQYYIEIMYGYELMQLRELHKIPKSLYSDLELVDKLRTRWGSIDDVLEIIGRRVRGEGNTA